MPERRLTTTRVATARILAAVGRPVEPLAREWGISPEAVRHAVTGRTWAHVTDPPPVVQEDPAARSRKLTSAQVADARQAVKGGTATITEIAARAHVARATVENAVYGRSWAHVTDPPPLPLPGTGQRPANSRLDAAAVADARRRYAAGDSADSIAAESRVSLTVILSAIHGHTWASVTDPQPVPVGLAGRRIGPPREFAGQARSLRAAGMTYQKIGEQLGVSRGQVWRMLNR